ncbi:MAG: hypothetical protein FJ403_06420 [Verrucomicrobia bacterium]|nr:hypothetical protein [Verrucomicrobiota bacterium]
MTQWNNGNQLDDTTLTDIFSAVMLRGLRAFLILLIVVAPITTPGQIDPEKRRLVQLGYNQYLEGHGPIAGYGFFYYNKPNFLSSNLTLRLAVAPIYLDADFGFSRLLGPNTDLAVGIAGGGFADTYSEIRRGEYRRRESFTGHGGEVSVSIYHRFNPDQIVPCWAIARGRLHQSYYRADGDTDELFEVPDDRTSFSVRTGIRLGGLEPSLTEPLALELSGWHETQFRGQSGPYGFAGDRAVESQSHLLWTRALLKYTFDQTEQLVVVSLTAGTSFEADRFSSYRLGGLLPFVSDFPLSLPGYYFQEISARRFVLLNGEYSFPFVRSKNWRLTMYGATGPVEYVEGLKQLGKWHTGVGGGISYISPSGAWFMTLVYGHGFDAIRDDRRGANQVGLLFQYDFEAKPRGKKRWFIPGVDPYQSRGGERIFR